MKSRHLLACAALLGLASILGCARAVHDTTGFAMVDSVTIDRSLDETWDATKAVLREHEYEIYTRDKRGVFVAYTPMRRHFRAVPHRTQFSISLDEAAPGTTEVTIETVDQVFGVTLLTQPDWHDRKTTDNSQSLELLAAIQAKTQ